VWHTLGADQVLHSEGVDAQQGLSSAQAAARAERYGPNTFAAGHAEPGWHAFARQYADPMQLVLLAAGIGSLYPLKQLGTGLLLPPSRPILTRALLVWLALAGLLMAVGTLSVIRWADTEHGLAIARTMGMV
jgi:magnesium-transporting ATPase (P-type)